METISRDEFRRDENFINAYIRHLEKKIGQLLEYTQTIKTEITRLDRDIKYLRNEIQNVESLPLLTGFIEDIIDVEQQRAIIDLSSGGSYVVPICKSLIKRKLFSGDPVALNNRNYAIVDVLPVNYDPDVRQMEVIERPKDSFYERIGGLEDQILEIRESIELPLLKPEIFKKIGIEPPRGVLLHGEPGTGKTLVARALANEINAFFIRVIGSELVQKFIGEGARYVREVFKLAKENAPSIIFLDELDAIGGLRINDGTSGDQEVHRTMMQLLNELDGFDKHGNVKFIAATNRIDVLDPALLRSGRFDRIVLFPLPDYTARESIFKIYLKDLNLEEDVNLKKILELTTGITGAEIKSICTEAGMFAIRDNRENVKMEDFLRAIKKVMKNENKLPESMIT